MAIQLKQESFDLFQDGDRNIFKTIYDAFEDEIYGFCLVMLKQKQDAEAATANTFFKLWGNRTTITGPDKLKAFIYTIARHICLDFLKEKGRREKTIRLAKDNEYEEDSIPELNNVSMLDEIEADMQEKLIDAIYLEMEKLPPTLKQIFRLKDIENKSVEEIASIMNMTESAIYYQRTKACEEIYKALKRKIWLLLIAISQYLMFFLK